MFVSRLLGSSSVRMVGQCGRIKSIVEASEVAGRNKTQAGSGRGTSARRAIVARVLTNRKRCGVGVERWQLESRTSLNIARNRRFNNAYSAYRR